MIEDSSPVPEPFRRSHVIAALVSSIAALAMLAHFGGEAALAAGAMAALAVAAVFVARGIRNHELLRERCERNAVRQRLSDAVYANSTEAMLVTDANARILTVNLAFERITGYAPHQVIGKNPSFQSSGRQDKAFYQAMWAELLGKGVWQGEIWNRRRTGETYAVWQTITAVRDQAGQPTHYVSLFSDITVLKNAEEQLRHLAYHDPLTGLSNRLLFTSSLDQSLARAERHGRKLAVMFVDLDHFKAINDTLGHASGDFMLENVAKRLRGNVRAQDVVARMGGDEFTVMLEDVTSRDEVARLASKLIETIGMPLTIQDREVAPSASIGIALFPDDAADAGELMKAADAALYRAKASGRRRYGFYTEELTRQAADRLQTQKTLRQAVLNGDLSLHYQPQYTDGGTRFAGFEAFVRWQHADLGLLLPGSFVPIAEESSLIQELSDWVIHEACRQAREWLDAGLAPHRISVNLTGKRLQHDRVAETIAQALADNGHTGAGSPFQFGIEISEAMLNTEAGSMEALKTLGEMGVFISLSGFGMGHSSLSLLRSLPIGALKVDRSFTRGLPGDNDSLAISRAIIETANSLGLEVVAEGVESPAQMACLLALGCSHAQGYLLGRPMPAVDLHQWEVLRPCLPLQDTNTKGKP